MESKNYIWLIGASQMAIDYANVLKALGTSFEVITRGEKSAQVFQSNIGIAPITGGLGRYLLSHPQKPNSAIVAVGVEQLKDTAELLLNYGVKNILLEKPGGINIDEITSINNLVLEFNANVYIGYNRRFYSSVIKAKEIICEDGGVTSFNFEFTEWSHIIQNSEKAPGIKESWFLCNSSHVIDTAFYLGGKPKNLAAFYKGGLDWHPASSVFSGAGISEKNALFSYHANWEAPGRWVIEISTRKHRLIFKPIETLQIQNIGSIAINQVEIDNSLDIEFKPGLYLETKAFLDADYSKFVTIQEQKEMIENFYNKMSGYDS